jgi:hypothetical protein
VARRVRIWSRITSRVQFSSQGSGGRENGRSSKRVVFRYNDNDKDTDVEVDILGDLPHYAVGDIVARRGKSWKVVRVLRDEALIGSQ